ncbi:thermonuclease family protein [Pseudenhygromyxa sp. WMMC2535]|uniref:thermonuclease family protein n=1 Tax=Pseudenhygromyxa sp. WMMC2535 TaxID=2712867 RepID=UPI0031F8DEDC
MALRPRLAIPAAALLFAAGCGFGGPLVDHHDSETGDDAAETGGTEGTDDTSVSSCGPSEGVVEWVIDGDTVVLESGERIRYLLIDTTEITNGKDECWGQEAKEYNSELVLGQTVSLEYDVECADQYGRLLAYISVQGYEVNRLLVENGYACVLRIPPNGADHFAEYQNLENAARQDGIGMWGACDPVPCD